ncbi:LysR family transcriptional regulator [Variovorax ureilyticus]|uniref:LysR family transcriptional regulator n=1 Tax=Variovorax ureilyticus TaxID=1836198 RepID=A0ABU8VM24_9BURK
MSLSASVLLQRLLAGGRFRHIQLLLTLAELGSIQRTAEAIGITQSSATQTLAFLEGLLETQLFHRHARGVRPTRACTDLLPIARNVLHGVAEGAETIAARGAQGKGSVRLLASVAGVSGLLVRGLPLFHEKVPHIQVHLREAEGEDQLLAISRGEVDMVACRKPAIIPEGWSFVPLIPDRLVVVGAAGHRLVRSRRVTWKVLSTETWLLPPADTAARQRFDEFAATFTDGARVYPLITRAPAMIRWLLVNRGMLSLLPLSFVQHLIDAGELAEVRTAESIPVEPLGLLIPQGGGAEAGARLAEFLGEVFSAPRI